MADDIEDDDRRPSPTPEGLALRNGRRAKQLSIRQAAKDSGLSEGRLRQIEAGYQIPAPGVFVPVIAPATTLARVAAAVGVHWREMQAAGREDVAEILRLEEAQQDPQGSDRHIERISDEALIRELQRRLVTRPYSGVGLEPLDVRLRRRHEREPSDHLLMAAEIDAAVTPPPSVDPEDYDLAGPAERLGEPELDKPRAAQDAAAESSQLRPDEDEAGA